MESDIIITVITSIPSEVVEYILERDVLSVNDVVQFGATCKQLREICMSKKLWKTKFFQSFKYPNLRKLFVEFKREPVSDWMVEVKRNLAIRRDLVNSLREMSSNHFDKEDLSPNDLSEFSITWDTSEDYRYPIMVDELLNLINNNDDENLTPKYYAERIFRHLKQSYLAYKWQRLINSSEEEHLLERSAIFVAQWFQPEERMLKSRLSLMLDDIAKEIRENLRISHPRHSMFRVSNEVLQEWRAKNIRDNQFGVKESRQILNCQCEVMFNVLGFAAKDFIYCPLKSYFLNTILEVKKESMPLMLCIVFESVARRLGVRCEVVKLSNHFLIRWKEKYSNGDNRSKIFYIDVLNVGYFFTRESFSLIRGICSRFLARREENLEPVSMNIIAEEIVSLNSNFTIRRDRLDNGKRPSDKLKALLELHVTVEPNNKRAVIYLAHYYLEYRMDPTHLVNKLIDIQNDDDGDHHKEQGPARNVLQKIGNYKSTRPWLEKVKLRSPDVMYAIGLILFNKQHDQFCVVFGWTVIRQCFSNSFSAQLYRKELKNGFNQPFYNALGANGRTLFIAQENLLLTKTTETSKIIKHDQLGKYFSALKEGYYLPNEELSIKYPQDAEARQRLLNKF